MKRDDNNEELKKYLFFGVIFLLLFLSFKIIQPYLILIVSSFILAYLVLPLFNKLNKKLNKSISAIICIFLIFIIILLPLGGIIGGVANQTYNLLNNENVTNFLNKISELKIFNNFDMNLSSLLEKGGLFVISILSSVLSYIPYFIISLIVLIFGIYYILINYDVFSKELKTFLPFKNKEKIAKEIDKSSKGIIYGSFLIAIIELIVSIIGFFISRVNPYLLLPALIFFFAFIPGLGPTVVWVPLAIYYLITHNWFSFIGVAITGIILSFYVDTVLRTKILGEKSKINPFIMLVGILGGISLFGIFGFIIGPLILIYSLKILREYFKK